MAATRLGLTVLRSLLNVEDSTEALTDVSGLAADYGRETFVLSLGSADTYLYVGFSKPFSVFYVNLTSTSALTGPLLLSYWNGSAWTSLTFDDRTRGLIRNGFVTWEAPADWAAKALTSPTGTTTDYFVRISVDEGTLLTNVISGLNIVYADDYDLQTEFPAVLSASFIPEGETSHIKTHAAARNQLTQDLRNKGFFKTDATGNRKNLAPWDLHDIEEVRQAATFLALSKIFFNYSDDPTDHWQAKSRYYEAKYKAAIDSVMVSFDADDDGKVSAPELLTNQVTRLTR